jgi:hypothetical protein
MSSAHHVEHLYWKPLPAVCSVCSYGRPRAVPGPRPQSQNPHQPLPRTRGGHWAAHAKGLAAASGTRQSTACRPDLGVSDDGQSGCYPVKSVSCVGSRPLRAGTHPLTFPKHAARQHGILIDLVRVKNLTFSLCEVVWSANINPGSSSAQI